MYSVIMLNLLIEWSAANNALENTAIIDQLPGSQIINLQLTKRLQS